MKLDKTTEPGNSWQQLGTSDPAETRVNALRHSDPSLLVLMSILQTLVYYSEDEGSSHLERSGRHGASTVEETDEEAENEDAQEAVSASRAISSQ